jgi:histidine triad (HIT) family protein
MNTTCVFCRIVRDVEPASVVWEDDLTVALLDQRQFDAGHTLAVPRRHLCDVCELDDTLGASLATPRVRESLLCP